MDLWLETTVVSVSIYYYWFPKFQGYILYGFGSWSKICLKVGPICQNDKIFISFNSLETFARHYSRQSFNGCTLRDLALGRPKAQLKKQWKMKSWRPWTKWKSQVLIFALLLPYWRVALAHAQVNLKLSRQAENCWSKTRYSVAFILVVYWKLIN